MTMICSKCGESAERLMCLALLIELGCSTSRDPSECREGGEHEFVKMEAKNGSKDHTDTEVH